MISFLRTIVLAILPGIVTHVANYIASRKLEVKAGPVSIEVEKK